jgi:DNA-binding MarR family transcriptional regulator
VDDRRKVMVRITGKGVELVARLRSALQTRVAEAMEETKTSDIDGLLASAGNQAAAH